MLFTIILFAMMLNEPSGVTAPLPMAYKSVACDFYGPDNAAKLLGARFRGEDGGMSEDADGRKWTCTFMQTGEASEKSRKIHFMLIKSPSSDAAAKAFDEIRASNAKKTGWQEWPGVGDEAIVHSDMPNFHLIMFRNGAKTIRIKVNPANGVSLDDSKSIAVSLATKLAKQ